MFFHRLYIALIIQLLTTSHIVAKIAPDVTLQVSDSFATLDNGLVNITFGEDGTITSIYKQGINLVKGVRKGIYQLDWIDGHSLISFGPSDFEVLEYSPDLIHIMYTERTCRFLRLELHFIMKRGLSGIYTYIKGKNIHNSTLIFTEFRTVNRFDPNIFDHITNGAQEGIPPRDRELKKLPLIQDTTWKLSNGKVYSKYDYAGYIRSTPYLGVFGNGFGAWLISPSREYHTGGPLKQELLVHQEALILNCFSGSHFGTPPVVAPPGWTKLYGPFLLYFNEGTNNEVKADVVQQTKKETGKWPYNWMRDSEYPLKRGTVTGNVLGPMKSMVVLSSSLRERFDLQTLGYVFFSETGKNGKFSIRNVRPGRYKLTAYPLTGYGIGAETTRIVSIRHGRNNVGILNLKVPKYVKWSLGETNRRSDIYRYSNERRNYIWQTKPPANLTFVIGRSVKEKDWYYAQTKKGIWSIMYRDIPNGRNRLLRVGLAAASRFAVMRVNFNGKLMKIYRFKNDQAVYRQAMQSGNYHSFILRIPRVLVHKGENFVSFNLIRGAVMYDSVNLI